MHPVVLGTVEDDGAAERAVDARDRHLAHGVDEHLVPGEDALGIGAGISVDRDAEHHVVVLEVVGVTGGDHLRVSQRRNAVLPDAAPDDLVEPDERLARPVEIRRESRVDEAVEGALEGRVARVPHLGGIPHRALPPGEVVAVLAADLGLHDPHEDGGDPLVAAEAHHLEGHGEVRRLPGRLDELHGARELGLFADQQGEERPGDGAVDIDGLGPRLEGGCRQHQEEAERDDGEADGGHRSSPRGSAARRLSGSTPYQDRAVRTSSLPTLRLAGRGSGGHDAFAATDSERAGRSRDTGGAFPRPAHVTTDIPRGAEPRRSSPPRGRTPSAA